MPVVIDTPELEIEHVETHDLTIEMPQTRRARPGFWRSLAHGITTYLPPTPREWQAPSCSAYRPGETPLDRLVREHPSLSVYVLAIIWWLGTCRLVQGAPKRVFGAPGGPVPV